MTFDDAPSDVTEFSEEQRKLLAYLLEEEGVDFAEAETIKARPALERIPLSFAQQRLWFLWRLEPEQALYNISLPLQLRGALGVEQLEQSINEIIARHEILRTVFVDTEPEPSQVVMPFAYRPLPVQDLTAFEDCETRARELAAADAMQPVDLQQGALIRCTLLKVASDNHVLLVTMHHIVSDGWSLGVFMRELAALYAGFITNHPASLPPLPIQYADYAYWQRETLKGATLEAELDFWKQQLEGAPPLLELPTDRPRPAVQTYNGEKIDFALPEELSEGLRALTRRQGCTLFITLLAGFAALLNRYAGQDDVVVGFPVANRAGTETENLIGLFANTLLMRARFEDQLNFMSLLEQVRETVLEAEAHQALPVEKLVEALRPQRDPSYSPLFQVMFTFQGERLPLELYGLNVQPLHIHGRTANFDLSLTMMESRDGLIGSWEYNPDLFDATTIARMIETFKRLLAEVVALPDSRVAMIPLLAEGERREMLAAPDVAATAAHGEEFVAVQRMFEAQAKSAPQAVALVCGEASLTYGELNERTNRLAHYLRARGVGVETRVGLCVEKSPEMIVGMLGILKAGGAYVPLDPQYPSERLAFMLEDAQLWGVLVQRHLADKLPASERIARIFLDTADEQAAAYGVWNPVIEMTGDNLCYVIYTSGSTGRPKGVMISHAALRCFTLAAAREYEIVAEDRVLQFASINFDASAEEIYPCLTHGATLVLRTDEMMGAIPTFLNQCHERAITVLDLPTAYWHELTLAFESEPTTFPPAVRLVIIGGEKARAAQLQSWRKHAPPGVRLINTYGPTEATVVATLHDLSQPGDEDAALQASIIGRAMHHAQALVLDRRLQLSLVGVPGELHIGGSALARGYLSRPDLTADKFIPHPFAAAPGERLYKTGDVVRYLPGGRLEFLRRLDQQVKVRGFRIELEEISATLAGHPQVRDAVVVLREGEAVDGQLVAYVVFAAESAPTSAQLREYLRERLPDYMLPSHFLTLPSLPLSPNGKLDRRALPAPNSSAALSAPHSRPALDADQQLLAALWAELLGLPHVGLDDDFFALGGHSLLATRLISRLRQLFGVELALRTLFEHTTLAAFTEQVRRAQRGGAGAADETRAAVPITARRAQRAPLSYGQQRLWFIQQLDEESAAYNIANAVRLRGPLDAGALERALREVVRRHSVLRTVIEVEGGEPVQVIEEGGEKRLRLEAEELVSASEAAEGGEATEAAITEAVGGEARRAFRLATEWPLRVKLWRVGENDHVLLVVLHHAAADGWSVGVLSRELSVLYGAYAGGGEESPLGELEIQYADYAMWQREMLAGEEMRRQVRYWKERLAGASGILELRGEGERGGERSDRGGEARVEVSAEVTEGLREVGAREGATMFMVMLSAFYALLYYFSNQRDISIGINTAGRNRLELEGLIGFFINMLVLRVDVSGSPRFSETLVQVRKTLLDAYAYQDVPFDKLVEELKPARLPGVTPFFQVVFNFNNRVAQSTPAGMPGIVTSAIPVGHTAVKFDLVLDIQERDRGLTGTMTYNAGIYDAATIEQLLRNFEVLLKHVAASPETHLDDLKALLAQADKQAENLKRREFRETRRKMFKHIAARTGFRAGAKGEEEL